MTLLPAIQVQVGVVKKFVLLFHLYTFIFLEVWIIRPMLNSNFSTKFYFLLNILRFPSIS